MIKYAENIGVDLSLIKSTIKKNNLIRSKYSDLELRETEQNVSFDDKICVTCPGGEIGRHKGLKIPEGNFVPVQVRPGHQSLSDEKVLIVFGTRPEQ